MAPEADRPRSAARVFTVYALVTLALVVALGIGLAWGFRAEAERRGLAEGTAEAVLVAETAVSPRLDGSPLADGLSDSERADMTTLATKAIGEGSLLRIRLRDLDGNVVFSDDGSGFGGEIEDEVLEAAAGSPVSLITRVNADANDSGPLGQDAVEVYLPLSAGTPSTRVGVLEMYVPYAPIAAEIAQGTRELYLLLGVGLAVLYVALFLVSWSVTQRLRREVRANRYLAEHDTLTGLPNRTALTEALDRALAAGESPAVAVIDIDRFKVVNDTLGHDNGDRVLRVVADRLTGVAGAGVAVARLGGDEFSVLVQDAPQAQAVLERLRSLLEAEIVLDDIPAISLGASVGYASAPEDGTDAEDLLQRAEIAMYVAKVQRLGVVAYRADLDTNDASALALANEVRRAIDAGELVVHYQPKVALSDDATHALEALVRWEHPRLGLLGPDRFIPLVEQTDLIHDLTDWVLAQALHDLALLGPAAQHLTVAVNVSARNLVRPDFPERVAGAVAASGIAPDRLVLEITETALLADPQRAQVMLRTMSESGVRASLDDFGVGQTSLSYVATLPVVELKVDRSFVEDMMTNPVHAAIVRSIVDLAHSLGMVVVAEGVETEDAAAALTELGCDLAQGYLFSRPLTMAALHAWLSDNPQRVPS